MSRNRSGSNIGFARSVEGSSYPLARAVGRRLIYCTICVGCSCVSARVPLCACAISESVFTIDPTYDAGTDLNNFTAGMRHAAALNTWVVLRTVKIDVLLPVLVTLVTVTHPTTAKLVTQNSTGK